MSASFPPSAVALICSSNVSVRPSFIARCSSSARLFSYPPAPICSMSAVFEAICSAFLAVCPIAWAARVALTPAPITFVAAPIPTIPPTPSAMPPIVSSAFFAPSIPFVMSSNAVFWTTKSVARSTIPAFARLTSWIMSAFSPSNGRSARLATSVMPPTVAFSAPPRIFAADVATPDASESKMYSPVPFSPVGSVHASAPRSLNAFHIAVLSGSSVAFGTNPCATSFAMSPRCSFARALVRSSSSASRLQASTSRSSPFFQRTLPSSITSSCATIVTTGATLCPAAVAFSWNSRIRLVTGRYPVPDSSTKRAMMSRFEAPSCIARSASSASWTGTLVRLTFPSASVST